MKSAKILHYLIPIFEDEQHGFKQILSGFPDDKVRIFTFVVENICLQLLRCYHEKADVTKYKKPSNTEYNNEIDKTLKMFEKVLEPLSEIAGDGIGNQIGYETHDIICTAERFNKMSESENAQEDQTAARLAQEIFDRFSILNGLLAKRKNHSKNVKHFINKPFATLIIESYREHIGEPTPSMNDPLYWVIALAFEAVQIKLGHPDRLIRSIL